MTAMLRLLVFLGSTAAFGSPAGQPAARSSASSTSSGLQHFTWFSYAWKNESHGVPLNASIANLAMFRSPAAMLDQPLPGLLFLPDYTSGLQDPLNLYNVTAESKRSGRSWLATDWRERVLAVAATVRRAGGARRVKGVLIGDELVCSGMPLANLTSVAAALKAALPAGIFLYTNECFETGVKCATAATCKASGAGPATCEGGACQPAAWPTVPPALDYISLDACKQPPPPSPRSLARSRRCIIVVLRRC
jgi:hypothetical protein